MARSPPRGESARHAAPPRPDPLARELGELVGAGRNGDAVEHFHRSIGVPPEFIASMRLTPEWPKMESIAHTFVYDCIISDHTTPAVLSSVGIPTLVIDSTGSSDDLTGWAVSVARRIPGASHRSVPGEWHGVADDVLAPVLIEFFRGQALGSQVATFALIHGGGGSSWDWHLVVPELREHGHDPVAVDLPSENDSADQSDYAQTVVQAVGDRTDLVVVGHSLGGFTAPLVTAHVPVELLVLVAAMIPAPGELFADWWMNTGYEESGYEDVFYHDVPAELAAEARRREREETSKALQEPWPLEAWPDTPTRYLLCRDDRMVPAAWARRHARERLGIDPDEMDGGHYMTLSRPRELAKRLVAYAGSIR